jgi:hypothetical protein
LLQTLVEELREAVEFDVFCQLDDTANSVKPCFAELHYDQIVAHRLDAVPKEETAAWWAHKNQQPVVIRVTDQLH